ncbi:MAG: arginine--tRNA ligase [Vampirovibrionales bacterium]|nr:arginine--tRNA ligase [Vampirovibrionales bacterium]
MLRETLQLALPRALSKSFTEPSICGLPLRIERPKNPDFGDLAVNVSALSKPLKLSPAHISEKLCPALTEELLHLGFEVTVLATGAFLNVRFSPFSLAMILTKRLATPADQLGHCKSLSQERVLLEFVSANPTGPLHVGHGRWAALGDAICRLLKACGASVTSEFYINDVGVQMNHLARSLLLRCAESLALGAFPTPVDGEPFPFYPGEYLVRLAEQFIAQKILSPAQIEADFNTFASGQDPDLTPYRAFAYRHLFAEQQALLSAYRVHFDIWQSEQAIRDGGGIEQAMASLHSGGYLQQAEGATWFQSSQLGDEKDRVLIKQDGSMTYLLPDIAYHREKFTRTLDGLPYTQIVNIWGADHHGYIARMKAAIEALGHDVSRFKVLLGQLVSLRIDGESARMGKRKKMLTLQDVIDAVGVDAARYWMVMRSADTHLELDVDLAASQSDENPVFYAQYAHARCAGILRAATEPAPNVDAGKWAPPVVLPTVLEAYLSSLTPQVLVEGLFQPLADDKRATDALRAVILKLDALDDWVLDAARTMSPHLMTQYVSQLAAEFHGLYAVCRVITDASDCTLARLALVCLTQRTIASALDLVGVTAPERM